MIEENHKNSQPQADNKKFKKDTPAISFVDDEIVKNRHTLNINKNESKENQ
jgi:hypothetical protein